MFTEHGRQRWFYTKVYKARGRVFAVNHQFAVNHFVFVANFVARLSVQILLSAPCYTTTISLL